MFHRTVSNCFAPALLVALLLVPSLPSSAMHSESRLITKPPRCRVYGIRPRYHQL